MNPDIAQILYRSATGRESGGRSSLLQPLLWLFGLAFSALVLLVRYHAPSWMLIFVCCLLAVLLSASLYGFLYCLHRYRSEEPRVGKEARSRGPPHPSK